ncbi:hypothetical protein [Actinomadura chibensis]|uniref:hypothetical protein n=1 Tax=Actinomadura chibensis TaxID=392828 RepID=UPI000833A4DD|nr:hypothetical protein [Actinomadura chibensis]
MDADEHVVGEALRERDERHGRLLGIGGRRDACGVQDARAVLALACAAQFMVVLDVSVVNVALPSVQRDLGLG